MANSTTSNTVNKDLSPVIHASSKSTCQIPSDRLGLQTFENFEGQENRQGRTPISAKAKPSTRDCKRDIVGQMTWESSWWEPVQDAVHQP
jgi:hypothetical protein